MGLAAASKIMRRCTATNYFKSRGQPGQVRYFAYAPALIACRILLFSFLFFIVLFSF